MSRYMEAINLLIHFRKEAYQSIAGDAGVVIEAIDRVLAMPESPGEQAIREGDEMAAILDTLEG